MDRVRVLARHLRDEDVGGVQAFFRCSHSPGSLYINLSTQISMLLDINRGVTTCNIITAEQKDVLERQPTLSTPGYEGFQYAQTMASFPPAAHDVFRFDDLLTQEERDIRYRTRSFMVRLSRAPSLPPYSAEAHATKSSTNMWGHSLA
jgi:hypothetical protein